ncbi:MAG: right-handed parallel beta-helix repeat-containing protein [Planctomycetes bacterium]|nr:right-handed parallel beta-helix repeat-containing protein [Planctomycetota bacterium]
MMKTSVVALVVLMLATVCCGAEYFVSPQGDDGAAGTSAGAAFRTIGKALAVAAAGDTVNLAPGTYSERAKPAASGSADAPITIRKTPGAEGEVVWTTPSPEPAAWEDKYALNLKERNHFVVDGVVFRDCTAWILMWDSSHNTVRRCTFDGADIYNCIRVNNGGYNRFLNCDFKRARPYVTDTKGVVQAQHAADYIELFRNAHHTLVEGCRFGQIGHVAVIIAAYKPGFVPTYNVIRNCEFADPGWKCVGLHAAEHTLIDSCTFSGKASVFLQFETPKTIVRRNIFHGFRSSLPDKEDGYRGVFRVGSTKDGGADCDFLHNRVYANVFTDNERTITSYSARLPIDDNIFKNNIIWNNRQTLWLCQPDYTTASKTYFVHNVLAGAAPGEKILGYGTERFALAEVQAAGHKLAAFYQGNIEAAPQFAAADKGDYRLKDGSPCIDAGADLTVTSAAGKGTDVPVDDSLYFCDGYGLIDGDTVVIGKNEPVRITKIDHGAKTLTVERALEWAQGDAVNLPYTGDRPDIGAYEHGMTHQIGCPPSP